MVSAAAESAPLTHVPVPEPVPAGESSSGINVGELERTLSILAGSLLITHSLHKLRLSSPLKALIGYRLINRGVTGKCNLYRALNVTTQKKDAAPISEKTFTHPLHQHIRVEKSITIDKPVEEVFSFWRNFENLPRFMEHLESVTCSDETHSHWVAKAPRNQQVEWDAVVVEEEPNRKIAWKSTKESRVPNAGQVLFSPAADNKGTEVKVILTYDPPGGIFGELAAKLFGEAPDQQVEQDLARFKTLLEAGATPDARTSGNGNPR